MRKFLGLRVRAGTGPEEARYLKSLHACTRHLDSSWIRSIFEPNTWKPGRFASGGLSFQSRVFFASKT